MVEWYRCSNCVRFCLDPSTKTAATISTTVTVATIIPIMLSKMTAFEFFFVLYTLRMLNRSANIQQLSKSLKRLQKLKVVVFFVIMNVTCLLSENSELRWLDLNGLVQSRMTCSTGFQQQMYIYIYNVIIIVCRRMIIKFKTN